MSGCLYHLAYVVKLSVALKGECEGRKPDALSFSSRLFLSGNSHTLDIIRVAVAVRLSVLDVE